ncbi:phage tail protein [Roseibacillus persicicus]|uniref:Phage tail collar domain-containing protein n=1 Tax=Roseibacillus persicicus TaxID=454148 RepID=A0A918TXB9_9BACT|nr:phage tail protein [Roseibacillus persicicus]GHC65187.1 hypothetical protein GCM10007100_36140 [Roseibacillus persicicus]
MKFIFKKFTTIFLIGLLSISASASELFNYSGKLTEENGNSLQDGQYQLTFRIWDNQTGGELLWGRTLPVQLVNDDFNVLLGNDTGQAIPSTRFNRIGDAFSLSETFVEVSIVSLPDGTPSAATFPRQQIASAAYAFNSQRARTADNGTPSGGIIAFGGQVAPEGWLLCHGQELNRNDYPKLFAAIGTAHGTSSETTFNLPDYRGSFLRGVDGPDGTPSDRDPDSSSRTAMSPGGTEGLNVGSVQNDAFQGHFHRVALGSSRGGTKGGSSLDDSNNMDVIDSNGEQVFKTWHTATEVETDFTNGEPRTSSETRPSNAYVNYIIKF